MVLHHQIQISLAIAAIAEAILMQISTVAILAQGCFQVLKTGHLQLLAINANICADVVPAVGHDHALFCAEMSTLK